MTTTPPRKPAKPRHGTVRRYKSGCHCNPCTAKNTEVKANERAAAKAKRLGVVPTPTKRVPTTRVVPTPPSTDEPTDKPKYGPIEAATRNAFSDEDAPSVAIVRREMAFAAARNMDDRSMGRQFASNAKTLREIIGDLVAAKPPKDGELDALSNLLGSFGTPRGRRDSTAVHDPEELQP